MRKNFFDDAAYNVAFERCIDILAELIEKYAGKLALCDIGYDYCISELAEMMNGFVNDEDNGWLMFNTKYCSADVAYSSIYSQAKKSVYLVDNYIGLRTLALLKNAPAGTDIKIFSDNIGSGKLHNVEYTDFCKEYPNINLSMQHTGGIFHDRFIVLDYGIDKYKPMIKKLLQNGLLQLP